MNPEQIAELIVGPALIALALWQLANLERSAENIRQYYNSRPDLKWGPAWLRRQFRPTERQARIMALLLIGVGFALGFGTILLVLGLDRSIMYPILFGVGVTAGLFGILVMLGLNPGGKFK
jgi:hypothetical protein